MQVRLCTWQPLLWSELIILVPHNNYAIFGRDSKSSSLFLIWADKCDFELFRLNIAQRKNNDNKNMQLGCIDVTLAVCEYPFSALCEEWLSDGGLYVPMSDSPLQTCA